jgi:D-alanine-D-alanine ligase
MNIALIVGGLSSEREVSLASGRGILKALRENGHFVKVIDPVYGDKEVTEDLIFEKKITKEYPSNEELKSLQTNSVRKVLSCINSGMFDDIDLAFLGLHGKYAEDGKTQTILEMRNIRYTGSDVISSAIALDKDYSKIIFVYNGIRTAEWMTAKNSSVPKYEDVEKKLGVPFVIKPNDEGSTVGLTIVKDKSEYMEAVNLAFQYTGKLLFEKYIKGRELTVSIVGEKAYPVVEIKPKNGFYDYAHKYTKGMTEYECPAQLSEDIKNEALKNGLLAHKSLGCSVYSRVDFILSEDNKLYCLEVNTLPGMTELSLVPKAAKALNIGFNELIEDIIKLSLKKYEK